MLDEGEVFHPATVDAVCEERRALSMKQMFSVLRHKGIPASSWKAEGPESKSYKIIEHKREFVPSALNCGKVTFVVQIDNDAANQETLVGSGGEDE